VPTPVSRSTSRAPARGSSTADEAARVAERRARVFRRRRVVVFGALGLVVLTVLYTFVASIVPLPGAAAATPAQKTIVQQAVQPTWPSWGSGAVSAVGMSGLIAQHGSPASVPMASMTKTITALVLLQKKPIPVGKSGPTITFTEADVKILQEVWAEDGSWAPVAAGDRLTERQALTAMLLPSANNYARSLAIWAYGSTSAFLSATKTWLTAHGFTHTRVTDASGLDPGSVASPADLVGIGKLVIANPVLASIVDTKVADLPGAGTVHNGNKVLGVAGIDGVKTGWTDQAGHCLLFASRTTVAGHTFTVVGVVLGAAQYADLWVAVPKLVTSVTTAYRSVTLADAATTFGSYTTVWGQRGTLTTTKPASMTVFSDTPVTVTVRSRSLQVARPGDDLGTVTFSARGNSITRTLTVTRPVSDPGLWWRLSHPLDLFL
jgi:D-alanyl-D-alanine carboxypeptidase